MCILQPALSRLTSRTFLARCNLSHQCLRWNHHKFSSQEWLEMMWCSLRHLSKSWPGWNRWILPSGQGMSSDNTSRAQWNSSQMGPTLRFFSSISDFVAGNLVRLLCYEVAKCQAPSDFIECSSLITVRHCDENLLSIADYGFWAATFSPADWPNWLAFSTVVFLAIVCELGQGRAWLIAEVTVRFVWSEIVFRRFSSLLHYLFRVWHL